MTTSTKNAALLLCFFEDGICTIPLHKRQWPTTRTTETQHNTCRLCHIHYSNQIPPPI